MLWTLNTQVRPSRFVVSATNISDARSGKTAKDKLETLRAQLVKRETKGMVITMLDEIAWLFNLRGSDIQYNPGTHFSTFLVLLLKRGLTVFFSNAIVTLEEATLYADTKQLSSELLEELNREAGVTVKPYDAFWDDLQVTSSNLTEGEKASLLPTATCEHIY